MPSHAFLANAALLAFLVSPAAAQNFVTNGDFSGGLAGWTQSGYTCNSGIQSFDVDGRGPSQSFWCMPGGQVTPPPYPPNTIEQNVTIVPGPSWEFSCDVSVYRPNSTSNSDAGTVYVTVNNVEIARLAFGSYAGGGEVKRARITARFTTNAAGAQPLKINFERTFLCSTSSLTPHHALDNVSLRIASGPTFGLHGNLKIGTSVVARAAGAPGAPFALFASGRELATGLSIPGIGGLLTLDPAGGLVLVFAASFDASGTWQANVPVPPDPALTMLPTFFQGIHVVAGTGTLGYHSGYVFVR